MSVDHWDAKINLSFSFRSKSLGVGIRGREREREVEGAESKNFYPIIVFLPSSQTSFVIFVFFSSFSQTSSLNQFILLRVPSAMEIAYKDRKMKRLPIHCAFEHKEIIPCITNSASWPARVRINSLITYFESVSEDKQMRFTLPDESHRSFYVVLAQPWEFGSYDRCLLQRRWLTVEN